MPKLHIASSQWLEAACMGNIAQLRAWEKSGALEVRYDPAQVGVVGKQGRAKIFDVCDANKENALHKALGYGQWEYARALLDLGQFSQSKNNKKETALHLAARGGMVDIVETLLDRGWDIDAMDQKGYTPLLMALDKTPPHEHVAMVLIERGANLSIAASHSCLDLATRCKTTDLLQKLLAHGADPNQYCDGATVLHYMAAGWDREDCNPQSVKYQMLRLLIMSGADPEKTADNRDGDPPKTVKEFFVMAHYEEMIPVIDQFMADYRAQCLMQGLPMDASTKTMPRTRL